MHAARNSSPGDRRRPPQARQIRRKPDIAIPVKNERSSFLLLSNLVFLYEKIFIKLSENEGKTFSFVQRKGGGRELVWSPRCNGGIRQIFLWLLRPVGAIWSTSPLPSKNALGCAFQKRNSAGQTCLEARGKRGTPPLPSPFRPIFWPGFPPSHFATGGGDTSREGASSKTDVSRQETNTGLHFLLTKTWTRARNG